MRATQRWLVSKIETKFRSFLTPVKLGEGWTKCLSQYFVRNLGPTSDICSTGEEAERAVWKIRGPWRKGQRQNIRPLNFDIMSGGPII